MWIPGPIYDRAPHYWLLIGLLLVIVGIYLGMEMHRAFLYVGVFLGGSSCVWALRVFQRRTQVPSDAAAERAAAD